MRSNTFVLRIEVENDAFCHGGMRAELARILRSVAADVEKLPKKSWLEQWENVRDVNGNTVGAYAVKPIELTPKHARDGAWLFGIPFGE